jgi:hypothetical protein
VDPPTDFLIRGPPAHGCLDQGHSKGFEVIAKEGVPLDLADLRETQCQIDGGDPAPAWRETHGYATEPSACPESCGKRQVQRETEEAETEPDRPEPGREESVQRCGGSVHPQENTAL